MAFLGIAGIVCAVLALESRGYAAAFASEEALGRGPPSGTPTRGWPRIIFGAVRLGQGRVDEAETRFTEALRLKPDYADAHVNLGRVLAAREKWPEAIAQDEAVVRLRPDDALACNTLAGALAQSGRLKEAEAEYERAVELMPRNAGMRNDLGLALVRLGRMPEAIDQFSASLRLKPGDAEVEANLGGALGQSGLLAGSDRAFLLRRFGFSRTMFARILIWARPLLPWAGKEEGREQLQTALRLDPQFSPARDMLGR